MFNFVLRKYMRVIAKRILREFWEKHEDSEQALKSWYNEASRARWDSPSEIKKNYARASILKNGRVVFNICGSRYRLIVEVNYERHGVYIRYIGSHQEYDKIDADKI